MNSDKREKIALEQYAEWMKATLLVDLKHLRYKTHYNINTTQLLNVVQQHAFFRNLDAVLAAAAADYAGSSQYELLMSASELQLRTKTYSSIINKSYRKNILFNSRFPNPPKDGWWTPDNWFQKCNDIVRGTIVTKYVDGPEFLCRHLSDHAADSGIHSEYVPRDNDSGYYAYHFYISVPAEIATLDMNPVRVDLSVEIQLTTQLQEVLRQLTHQFYEKSRISTAKQGAWKWEFSSPKFQASYLGHTLHLLEAIIAQIKNQLPGDTTEEP